MENGVPSYESIVSKNTAADQIAHIASRNRSDINNVFFGEIEFCIRAGKIYRVNLNKSLKLDAEILDEARDALEKIRSRRESQDRDAIHEERFT